MIRIEGNRKIIERLLVVKKPLVPAFLSAARRQAIENSALFRSSHFTFFFEPVSQNLWTLVKNGIVQQHVSRR